MPERSATLARRAALPARRAVDGVPPAPAPREAPPEPWQPPLVAQALLAWAEQDDGCMVLLSTSPDSDEPAVRWLNDQGAQLLGYARHELVGEPLDRLLRSPFAGVGAVVGAGAPLVDPRRTLRCPVTVQRRDGRSLRMALTSVPISGSGPTGAWLLRLVLEPDVERVEEALQTSHERFRALAEHAPIAIFSSETGLRLAYVNDRFSEVYGDTVDRLLGTGWLERVHEQDRASVVDALTHVLRGEPAELPLRVVRPGGEVRVLQARIVPVPHLQGAAGFVGTLDDVTERRAAELLLAHQAAHEPLTGLLNRRRLIELLGEQLVSATGPERPVLLFLDLDDFKRVNDSFGHEAGDRLLLEVAKRLSDAVREGDVVSRFGGDEFAVLCRGVVDEKSAGELAARLLEAVTADVLLGTTYVPVSASLGVVVAGARHREAEDVLRDADAAMYQAKEAGKNRWALFDEQARRRAQEKAELARDLRLALDAGDLTLQYQPVVGLTGADGVVLSSVEALCRWSHDVRGDVSPAAFVALAEENGLVPQLGLQVLRLSCAQMVRWRSVLGDTAPRSVSVNVSALQLRQPDFPEIVESVLRETGLPGSALCLELTESVVLHDTSAAAAGFWRLRELGVRIAIDDFGTGYSSLSILRRMPFDQLKIDRSLLTDLSRDTQDPVVAAVVAMGAAMDLAVVAEGVETAEQEAELRRLGCPLAQGFRFGRPMAPQDLELWARVRAVEPAVAS